MSGLDALFDDLLKFEMSRTRHSRLTWSFKVEYVLFTSVTGHKKDGLSFALSCLFGLF